MEKIKYTWEQFDHDLDVAVEILKPLIVTGVYGVPRGGLVIATALSHRLGIPLILNRSEINSYTLICDDIADTGKTLNNLLEDARQYQIRPITLTLHYKKGSLVKPDVWMKEATEWIVYPWETLETSQYDNR